MVNQAEHELEPVVELVHQALARPEADEAVAALQSVASVFACGIEPSGRRDANGPERE
jgi:hypothetical protein